MTPVTTSLGILPGLDPKNIGDLHPRGGGVLFLKGVLISREGWFGVSSAVLSNSRPHLLHEKNMNHSVGKTDSEKRLGPTGRHGAHRN